LTNAISQAWETGWLMKFFGGLRFTLAAYHSFLATSSRKFFLSKSYLW